VTDTRAPSEFEEGMRALETIVARLEAGQLTLEEALAAYEQGEGIVRRLNEKLSEAEQRLEVLSRGADGRLHVRPLNEEKG